MARIPAPLGRTRENHSVFIAILFMLTPYLDSAENRGAGVRTTLLLALNASRRVLEFQLIYIVNACHLPPTSLPPDELRNHNRIAMFTSS